MIDPAIESLVGAIHAAPHRLVLEFTGAGSLGLAWLHAVGGSSRTILEATDRYSATSLNDLLEKTPEKFVSPETAVAMAERAYLRAHRLGDDVRPCLGVGCTATIATDRTKGGEHRVVIAVRNSREVATHDLLLTKGQRQRHGEESLVAALMIRAIARAMDVTLEAPITLIGDERIIEQTVPAADPLVALSAGTSRAIVVYPDGRRVVDQPIHGVIFSGSFNPLHFGHEALAAAATRVTGLPVTFELPAVNADKAPIGRSELERRIEQFRGRYPVVVTRTPLFRDKAHLFGGCTFVVGYDTAVRLVDSRFYGGSQAARDQALAAMRLAGCQVLVAGRWDGATFRTLGDLSIPAAASGLFIELPQAEFRADISATLLRQAREV